MIKCKDCKAFSPQSEYGGVCSFTNLGTVKNDDGCRAGAIINDIYNLGRVYAIDEVIKLLNSIEYSTYNDDTRRIEHRIKAQLIEQLEQIKEK